MKSENENYYIIQVHIDNDTKYFGPYLSEDEAFEDSQKLLSSSFRTHIIFQVKKVKKCNIDQYLANKALLPIKDIRKLMKKETAFASIFSVASTLFVVIIILSQIYLYTAKYYTLK